jgi:outer membrane receptor protein involved in Fe transport
MAMKTVLLCLALASMAAAQQVTIAGKVLDPMGSSVPKATVQATDGLGRVKAETQANDTGEFVIQVTPGIVYSFVARAPGFEAIASDLKEVTQSLDGVELAFGKLATATEVLTVTAHVEEPSVDQRDAEIFNRTLFTRDDQIFQTLGAGLSLGQHAGGGKSLEVRRFGFNLDHGGTGGGIKVMLDGIQQNSVSGGHAHGYLGSIKGLSPELVQDVSLINGPFNAQYGDFSGLGVVNIVTRDEMPDVLTGRIQLGQYNTRRFFGAYSPQWNQTRSLIALESSYSDGPYKRPLEYQRNNLTGVWSRSLSPTQNLTFRIYGATNDSYAAGQLPVDQIQAGLIDRFGNIDPNDGNSSTSGTFAGYYTKNFADGSVFKVDGMANRLLFDLFSNFTFFLDHPDTGDGFIQHDSRLQEATNVQYQKPHTLGSSGANFGTLFTGMNFLGNQINLKLAGRQGRVPTDLRTWSQADIFNTGFYGQENLVMLTGKLRLDAGLRYDTFSFGIQDHITTDPRRVRTGGAWQPKAGLAYTPLKSLPLTFHANYGRAITSSNSRALIDAPDSPLIANTDFYMLGTSYNYGRFSFAANTFFIDRSLETLYAADDGTTEFTTPSRSYGWEAKTSYQLTPTISWNGSVTKVMNAFYRGTEPRVYIDRAPHFTAYSALTVSNWRGFSGSIRMRAINRYILNGEGNGGARVPGHTVWDFSVARRLNPWLELNFAADNILDKVYYETFEMYTSQLRGQRPIERVHGTAGYPRTIMAGVTIRLFAKAR